MTTSFKPLTSHHTLRRLRLGGRVRVREHAYFERDIDRGRTGILRGLTSTDPTRMFAVVLMDDTNAVALFHPESLEPHE